MKRIAAGALALSVLATAAAMAGPVEDRVQLMKDVQAATKDAAGLARGTAPFDATKVKADMQVYIDAAAKLPGLFPKGSESDTATTKTTAAPKVFADAAGLKAAAVKFAANAKAAQAATDQASFAAAFKTVSADCGACHREYRIKKD